jgi:uncharacterized protein YjbI with pentapeptide repeats
MALTRSIIAKTLSSEIGLSRKDSVEVVSVLLDAILKSLKTEEDVRIRNFGRFRVVSSKRRRIEDFPGPRLLPQLAKKVVKFKCSKALRVCLRDDAGVCKDISNVNAIIEQLQKNIEKSDQLRNALDAHCRWVESEGSKGRRANLARFDMRGADLFGSNLKSANLLEASLGKADLSDCDLENANLENADLKGASIAWANIRDANLRGACLIEADLRWADLRRANLSEADFRRANLEGADLRDAILMGADFRGAKLKNTILEKRNFFSPARLKLRFENNLKL